MRARIAAAALTAWIGLTPALQAFQLETTDDPDCTEAPGRNCPHRGASLSWRSFPVPFSVNSDGSDLGFGTVRDAVSAAFDTWERASSGRITFNFAGQVHNGSNGQDGLNTISFQNLGADRDDTFAQSIVTFDSDSGQIFDVDVELSDSSGFAILPDGQDNPLDPRADLQAITTHEAGHFLGLDHENTMGEAIVMYFEDHSGNTTHRNLTSDDSAGVRTIYLGSSAGSGDGDGGGGGGGGGGCAVGGSSAAVGDVLPVALLLGLLALRRRRPSGFHR